jgi:hypothetical protein
MGTSLCGMNADRMVETPSINADLGVGLGSVIINFQRTQMDEVQPQLLWFCGSQGFIPARLHFVAISFEMQSKLVQNKPTRGCFGTVLIELSSWPKARCAPE